MQNSPDSNSIPNTRTADVAAPHPDLKEIRKDHLALFSSINSATSFLLLSSDPGLRKSNISMKTSYTRQAILRV